METCPRCGRNDPYCPCYPKGLLCHHLNQGKAIKILRECAQCQRITPIIVGGDYFVEDASFRDYTFDIASIRGGEFSYGIQIRPPDHDSNDLLPWYQLDAFQVVKVLSSDKDEVLLADLRQSQWCSHRNCISLKLIAVKLGCYRRRQYYPERGRSRILLDIVHRGKYVRKYHTWDIGIRGPKWIWNELIRREQCLRCGISCEVKIGRPYCSACYELILRGSDDKKEKKVRPEAKAWFKDRLAWLDAIPEGKDQCHFCDGKGPECFWIPGAARMELSTWWFGTDRQICTRCLDEEMEKRGLFQPPMSEVSALLK